MSLNSSHQPEKSKRLVYGLAASALIVLIGMGIFASNGWFPNADPVSGRRTGWFGKPISKNAPSSWNPLAMPSPTPSPQLSKELIYAGSRLLAVEDKNASAAPPADLAVWRPSSGMWYVLGGVPGSSQTSFQFGASTDTPVPGDFDGDGKTDFAVFRESTGVWYVTRSSDTDTSYYDYNFGQSGDKPVAADFDGDGKTDVAVFRPNTTTHLGTWYYMRSSDDEFVSSQYGLDTDIPAPADFDGDGKADLTVWRSSNATFYTVRSTDTTTQSAGMSFSSYTITSSDKVVSADYDGDGKANYAIRNGSTWLMLDSSLSNMTPVTPSGDSSGDIPVPNDYDGDGKCDIAVWRDSNGDWYIRKSGSSNALRQEHWGMSGDIPVPAYFRR